VVVTHIKLLGDSAVAARYVGIGRSLVQQIETGVRPSKTTALELHDASIDARIVGTQAFITITGKGVSCTRYLESGHAKYGQYHHNRPNASDPATVSLGSLAYDDAEENDELFGGLKLAEFTPPNEPQWGHAKGLIPDSVDFPSLKDETGRVFKRTLFKSGEHSPKAFFKAPRLNEDVPSEDPYEATDGSGAAGSWPICTALEMKKAMVAKVPPSLYSGKMRLFVQALYGAPLSVAGVQALDVYEAISPARLKMKETIFDFSTGIFTSDDGTYWLIDLGTKVTVTRIHLSECGKSLSKVLAEYPPQGASAAETRQMVAKFEAYIFADATLDESFRFTLADIPAIQPLAYGWKFNWAGTEASCISFVQAGSGNDTYYNSSKQSVSISRDSMLVFSESQNALTDLEKERLRWQVTSSDTGTVSSFNFPWGSMFVWAPVWAYMQQYRRSGLNNFEVPKPGAGSIYGWYDIDDVFQEVHATHGTSETDNYASHDWYPPGDVVYDGLDLTYEVRADAKAKHIFTVSGIEKSVEVGSGTYAEGWFRVDGNMPDGPPYHTTGDTLGGPTGDDFPGTAIEGFGLGGGTPYVYSNQSGSVESKLVLRPTTDETTLDALRAIQDANDHYGSTINTEVWPYNIGFSWSMLRYKHSTYDRYLEEGSKTFGGAIALVIPFYDSEAAFCFKQQQTTKTSFSTRIGSGEVGPALATNNAGVIGLVIGYYSPDGFALWYRTITNVYKAFPDTSCCPYTYATGTPSTVTDNSVTCFKKDGAIAGVADNYNEIFDPSVLNEVLDTGNYCFTYTSAVHCFVNGSNVPSSHADFAYNTGTFIGWF